MSLRGTSHHICHHGVFAARFLQASDPSPANIDLENRTVNRYLVLQIVHLR